MSSGVWKKIRGRGNFAATVEGFGDNDSDGFFDLRFRVRLTIQLLDRERFTATCTGDALTLDGTTLLAPASRLCLSGHADACDTGVASQNCPHRFSSGCDPAVRFAQSRGGCRCGPRGNHRSCPRAGSSAEASAKELGSAQLVAGIDRGDVDMSASRLVVDHPLPRFFLRVAALGQRGRCPHSVAWDAGGTARARGRGAVG